MKQRRQRLILELIRKNNIESQNQLIEMLKEHGIEATQATISRDIKELRLVKELSQSGNYRYVIAGDNISNHTGRLKTIFRESVTSCARAQNLVIIKTLPGLASAVGSAIDKMEIVDVAGTLAGDDTVFIATMTNEAAERFLYEIEGYLV